MGYLQEFDRWFDERLRDITDGYGFSEDAAFETKREIKGKILESYRNGQKEVITRLRNFGCAAILKEFESREKPAKPKPERRPERKRYTPRRQKSYARQNQ